MGLDGQNEALRACLASHSEELKAHVHERTCALTEPRSALLSPACRLDCGPQRWSGALQACQPARLQSHAHSSLCITDA